MTDFKYPQQKQKTGRCIYGTVTAPENFNYTGTKDEMNEILNYLKSTSKMYEFVLLSKELHESKKIHYHYIIKYTNIVRETVCNKMYDHFHSISGAKSDRILFTQNNYILNVIGYCAKYDDYVTDMIKTCKIDVEFMIKTYKNNNSTKELCESKGIKPKESVVQEQEIINYLILFMEKNNYKVNSTTRLLYGISEIDFFTKLYENGFNSIFGVKGVDLCKRLISDNCLFYLPMWTPNESYVKFKSCFYNMETGKQETLDECKNIIPIIELDMELDYSIKKIEPYLNILKLNLNEKQIEQYRYDLGRQFRKKTKRSKMLYLYGIPSSGKSTLAIPYVEITRNILGIWADDKKFSMAHIAPYKKIFSDEVNPFDTNLNLNEIKKLGEGVEFNTNVKHSNPISVIPKTGIFISNHTPPDPTNNDIQALLDRFSMYEFDNRLDFIDPDFMDTIISISPLVMVWATMK